MWTSWLKINSTTMTKLILEWRGIVCALGMSRAIFVKGELSSGIPLETQTLSAGKGELSSGIPAETQTLSAGKGTFRHFPARVQRAPEFR